MLPTALGLLHALRSLHSDYRLRFNSSERDCSTQQHSRRKATSARIEKLPLHARGDGRTLYASNLSTNKLTNNAWLLQTRAEWHAARMTSACYSTVSAEPS